MAGRALLILFSLSAVPPLLSPSLPSLELQDKRPIVQASWLRRSEGKRKRMQEGGKAMISKEANQLGRGQGLHTEGVGCAICTRNKE